MALTPDLVLSAANPSDFTAGSPSTAPYLVGYLHSYGGSTFTSQQHTLPDQAGNDELLLGYTAADPTDENDITDWWAQIPGQNAVQLSLGLRNLEGDEQVLLIYGLKKGPFGDSVAQFFVGVEFLRSAVIDDSNEAVAILVDAPSAGDSWMTLYLRIAGPAHATAFFTGVEAFII